MNTFIQYFKILAGAFQEAILITGLVVIIMMVIESLNIGSRGQLFSRIGKNSFGQILLASGLGAIPGCMGGFATVSLYTHRLVSFGALVATLVATAGDEAFFMLALFPGKAMYLFGILFVLALIFGFLADRFVMFRQKKGLQPVREDIPEENIFPIHDEHCVNKKNTFTWKRLTMIAGVCIFLLVTVSGVVEAFTNSTIVSEDSSKFVLSAVSGEAWIHVLFVIMAIVVLFVLCLWPDHFVEEHLWGHIIKRHFIKIFSWTFSVLAVIALLSAFADVNSWISENVLWMFVLAILIGMIPQSGPNMIFVTLFAGGVIPFPILLANSIVQDGHASLPLIAESRRSFFMAKALKIVLACAICLPMLFV